MRQLLKQHKLLRFWMKLGLLTLPFLPFVVLYFVMDPFMVLHDYKDYRHARVSLSEAFLGWQNYMKHRDSLQYDAFLLGNSCTMAFSTKEWERHLDSGSRAVNFFDNGETLGGVCQKIEALDAVDANLKQLMVVLDCASLCFPKPQNGSKHLFSPHAEGMTPLEYHLEFMQDFFYPNFLISYLKFMASKTYDKSMRGVIRPDSLHREPCTNNFINPREAQIDSLGEAYWQVVRHEEFVPRLRAGEMERPVVGRAQEKLLEKIASICRKHGTHLIWIIGPDYYQRPLNPVDLEKMRAIFGEAAVWDFTGINEYTSDLHNYYEPGHYRPCLGARLLNVIYDSAPQ